MRKILSFSLLAFLLLIGTNAWGQFVVEKVTATSGLVSGEKYIIVCGGQNVAMGVVDPVNEKFFTHLSATITSSLITATPNDLTILTLGSTSNGYSLQSGISGNYLSLTGYSNELKQASSISANKTEEWTIVFESNGDATIRNVAYPTAKKTNSTVRRIEYNKNSGQERFACYGSTQQTVQLYHVIGYKVNVTTAGWASLCLPFKATIPTNAKAYFAIENVDDDSKVTLRPFSGTVIPANTGVVIRDMQYDGLVAHEYQFNKTDNNATDDVTANIMVGSVKKIATPTGGVYVLASGNGTTCTFNTFTGDNLDAYKSYIPQGSASAPSIHFVIDEENGATNIGVTDATIEVVKFFENGRLLIKKGDVVYDALGNIVR